jgi:hypothetical protein
MFYVVVASEANGYVSSALVLTITRDLNVAKQKETDSCKFYESVRIVEVDEELLTFKQL